MLKCVNELEEPSVPTLLCALMHPLAGEELLFPLTAF